MHLPPGGDDARLLSQPRSYTVEPATQCLPLADGACLAGQYQERCLEHILGILFLTEQTPADAHDQRPMSPYQHGEGFFITVPGEALHEFSIARPLIDELAKKLNNSVELTTRHDPAFTLPLAI